MRIASLLCIPGMHYLQRPLFDTSTRDLHDASIMPGWLLVATASGEAG